MPSGGHEARLEDAEQRRHHEHEQRHTTAIASANDGDPVRIEPRGARAAPRRRMLVTASASCSRWIASAGIRTASAAPGDEVGAPSPQLQHQALVVDVQRDAREAAEEDALLDAPDQRVGGGRVASISSMCSGRMPM